MGSPEKAVAPRPEAISSAGGEGASRPNYQHSRLDIFTTQKRDPSSDHAFTLLSNLSAAPRFTASFISSIVTG